MEWWNAKKSGDEWHKLILIGIYTGLRLGDCCRLDWSQISLAQGVIQLVPRKTRRHHQRIATIPIHQALGAALVGQQAYDSKEGGLEMKLMQRLEFWILSVPALVVAIGAIAHYGAWRAL